MKNLPRIKTIVSNVHLSQPTSPTYKSPPYERYKKMNQNKNSIQPIHLLNITREQATRICQYITALERQTNSKDQQRILMQKYIECIKKDFQQLATKYKNSKDKQENLKNLVQILKNDKIGLVQQIRVKDQKIKFIQKQLTAFEYMVQQKKIEKMAQQQQIKNIKLKYQNQLSQEITKNRQLNQKINILVSQLYGTQNKYMQMQNQLKQLYEKYKTLEQINQKIKNQMLQNNTIRENILIEKQNQLQAFKENFKMLENLNKFLQKDIQKYQQQCKQQIKLRQKLQQQLKQINNKSKNQHAQYTRKQKNLQQFIIYIKKQVRQLQQTIHIQQQQITSLHQINQKLKNQILETITKLTKQFQYKKDNQLNKIQIQLVRCKRQLAQKERYLLGYLNSINKQQYEGIQCKDNMNRLQICQEQYYHYTKDGQSLQDKIGEDKKILIKQNNSKFQKVKGDMQNQQ